MDDLAQLAAQLSRIEDRTAITDLIHAHAEHVRAGTMAQAAALFDPDAVYEIRHFGDDGASETVLVQRIEGIADILDSVSAVAGDDARLWPMIHNVRIELDGDHARSVCVSQTVIWPQGLDSIGEYRDTFRKEDGRWRFATRTMISFGGSDGVMAATAYINYQATKN